MKKVKYNLNCKIHGDYIGKNSRQCCYKCVEIKEIFLDNFYLVDISFFKDKEIINQIDKNNISMKEIIIPGTTLKINYWKCNSCEKFFIKHRKNLNKMFNALEEDSIIYCSHLCSNSTNILKRTKKGICITCKAEVESRDSIGNCKKCSAEFATKRTIKNQGKGFCIKCGEEFEIRDLNGFCDNCKPINDTFFKFGQYDKINIQCNEFCNDFNLCKDKKINLKNIYGWCIKSSNFRNAINFDEIRKKLKNKLKDKLENNNFFYNNKIILFNNIIEGKFDNIPGIWALWGKDNFNKMECLTVGQSINMGKELKWTLRVLANEKLQQQELDNPGCTGRWNKIQKYKELEYRLVKENIQDFNERELIEALCAIKNDSLYWLPSPTQISHKFSKRLEEYNG